MYHWSCHKILHPRALLHAGHLLAASGAAAGKNGLGGYSVGKLIDCQCYGRNGTML